MREESKHEILLESGTNEIEIMKFTIGGNLYGTKAGLLINDQMQVVGTDGRVIPGLYAGWHTAGGACGENSYIGDPILGSLMGDVGLAFCGGYLCGTSAVENEMGA